MNAVTFDRLAGILVAAAAADALGAGYEFGGPVPATTPLTMRGQGAFHPGEWTDDTAQFLAIVEGPHAGFVEMQAVRPARDMALLVIAQREEIPSLERGQRRFSKAPGHIRGQLGPVFDVA